MAKDNPWGIDNHLDSLTIIDGAQSILSDLLDNAKLSKEIPKDNVQYRLAVFNQVNYVTNLLRLIRKNSTGSEFSLMISVAMFLRTLIEVTANIAYFANHKNDLELANKFISTSFVSWNNLMAIKDHKEVKRISWTKLSVKARINLLSEQSEIDYYKTYQYLSSFIHCDAGYAAAIYSGNTESTIFRQFYGSQINLCLADIIKSLDKIDELDKGYEKYVNRLEAFLREENNKLKRPKNK